MNLKKRSFSLDGHATSVALEPEFWAQLDQIAKRNNQSLAALVKERDSARGLSPLASALRVWVLQQALQSAHLPPA